MTQSSKEPKIPDSEKENIEFLNGSDIGSEKDPSPPVLQDTIDFIEKIELQIKEEVRAKRSQGAFPPGFERRLKTLFQNLVPPGAGNSRRDFEALLRSSDRAAYFDIDVPIASQKPGVAAIKRLLRTTQAWYLNYLAQQLNNFTTNLMRLLYVFDSRLNKLEESTVSRTRVRSGGDFMPGFYPETDTFSENVVAAVKNLSARVLVADCGDGYLVWRLREAGADSYGVDSFGQDLENPFKPNLDLRWQDLNEHFNEVADGALAGILLQGSIDLLPPDEKLNLITSAERVLGPRGTIVLLSADPTFFDSSPRVAIHRDLAPGRPFAPETWQHVLARLGFTEISISRFGECNLISGFKESGQTQNS